MSICTMTPVYSHPVLGLCFLQEFLQCCKESDMADETRAGHVLGFLLGES